MLERRDVLGGACVTEEVWPGQRVSRASYVVSMLQPKVVYDLRLKRLRLRADPARPAVRHLRARTAGRSSSTTTPSARARRSPATRRKDAAPIPSSRRCWRASPSFLRPLMLRPPPALGSKRPGRPARPAARGRPRRRARAARRARAVPRDDDVGRRPARRLVRDRRAEGRVRLDRRGRRLGRARARRAPPTTCCTTSSASWTACSGAWGHVKGGMGAHQRGARAAAPRPRGATIRTDAAVRSIDVRGGRATGVTLESRRDDRGADRGVSGAHPRTTVLDLVGGEHFPDEVVERHGALPQPRRLGEGQLHPLGAAALRGRRRAAARAPASRSAPRSTTSSAPGRTRRSASPPRGPYIEVEVPTPSTRR